MLTALEFHQHVQEIILVYNYYKRYRLNRNNMWYVIHFVKKIV